MKIESESVVDRLIELTEGDLRRSINTLQTCSSFGKDRPLTCPDIESISGVVPEQVIAGVVSQLTDTSKVITYSDIQNMVEELILEGYDCQ